jgi:hypothetical protein
MTSTWRIRAACRGADLEAFFPAFTFPTSRRPSDSRLAADREAARPALAVCGTCSVHAECLAEAVRVGDRWAVRGGTVPGERAAR